MLSRAGHNRLALFRHKAAYLDLESVSRKSEENERNAAVGEVRSHNRKTRSRFKQ